jgi:hypothetical protein
MWVIFALLDLDPNPDSGSTYPIESRSNTDPETDLQPWYYGESVDSKFTRGHGIFSAAVCYCHSSVAGSGNDDSCVNPLKKAGGKTQVAIYRRTSV